MRTIAKFLMFVLVLSAIAGCGASSVYSPPPTVDIDETKKPPVEYREDLSRMPNKPWPGLFLLEEWREGHTQRVVLFWHDGDMRQMEEESAILLPYTTGVFYVPANPMVNLIYTEIHPMGKEKPEVIGCIPDSPCCFKTPVAGGPDQGGLMLCLNGVCGYFYKAYLDGEVQILPESKESCQTYFEQFPE